MENAPASPHQRQRFIERKLLASLCRADLSPETRVRVLSRLSGHVFIDADHQVIHRALASMQPAEPVTLSPALAQATTRLGFPDLDFAWLFSEAPANNEIPRLLEGLSTTDQSGGGT